MQEAYSQTDLRPSVSVQDLKLILSAIGAYSHNVQYRNLLERLRRQADMWGVLEAPRQSGR